MKPLFTLLIALLVGPLVVAQSTLSVTDVFALSDQDTIRWGDVQLQLDGEDASGNAYILTGENVVAALQARLHAADGEGTPVDGQATVLTLVVTVKAHHEKLSKRLEWPVGPEGTLAAAVTEQFKLGPDGDLRPVTLFFNMTLE